MQINWFTVIAQIINFLVLVWLLKRFLYHPILKAIDEREKKIASELKDAETKKAEAIKEQDEFRKKNEKFDADKNELMSKAVTETAEERRKMLDEARDEAKKLSTKLEAASKEAHENMNHEISERIEQEVFAVTRKTLTDLASVSIEEQSVKVFIKRLNELKEDEKKQFISSFNSVANTILVRSAFDLPSTLQADIQKTIVGILGDKARLEFKTAPELISGIELTTNGYKLAWSIAEYLRSFEKNISEKIKVKPKEEPKKVEVVEKPVPKEK